MYVLLVLHDILHYILGVRDCSWHHMEFVCVTLCFDFFDLLCAVSVL